MRTREKRAEAATAPPGPSKNQSGAKILAPFAPVMDRLRRILIGLGETTMSKITRRQAAGMAAAGGFWLTGAAKALAAPVDESGFVRIGGIDQWIGVRGPVPARRAGRGDVAVSRAVRAL